MKNLLLGVSLVLSPVLCGLFMAQSPPPKLLAKFPGAALKWVRLAEPEFQRRNLELDKYTISVIEQEQSVIVVLTSPDAVEGARGSSGTYPGFEVEISTKDLKVVRSNYVR